ncbi:Filamentous haemagglutinin-like protein (plasmid) [Nostoc sp. NIES-3756]|uniref:two-partner secretion domain-containing protein n=1 Tax=Nostoc sp. NIES-3756 TaxID=1751286 RepID=UPI00071FBB7F|nr:filamentous hemagglutinin N-terminal domain-containing protein [Nostoc sp. NIES-3756]BAT56735.1 Filamentous haemagglutinin-like protein [Nostoc sp. NIES-3756]
MNKKLNTLYTRIVFSFTSFICFIPICQAQINADNSLQDKTLVNVRGNITFIEGGTQLGNNLFHSFQDFSINNGDIAYFNNALNVQNIISRVTGNSISNINGIIRSNGRANLFIINPNGFFFGNNASLNIGGSFLATTANSIWFSNDINFSANHNPLDPLLKISVPLGLVFTGNSRDIKVQGNGHNINRIANNNLDFITPIDARRFSGLQVQTGNSIALIGGNVSLDGGILSAKNGQVQIGSVQSGYVALEQSDNNINFNFSNVNTFNNIVLTNNSLLFVNSNLGSRNTINIQGKNINVLSGSLVFAQNHGFRTGSIKIRGQALNIQGASNLALSAIYTSNFGATLGESIELDANDITIQGGQIATTTFTNAPSGPIFINSDSLKIFGEVPSYANPDGLGGINTFSYSSGKGGDITAKINNIIIGLDGVLNTIATGSGAGGNLFLDLENLILKDGGASLGSSTFRSGHGGNVFIKSQNIDISGQSPSLRASNITSSTFGNGNAGNIDIGTLNLIISNGGGISSSTLSAGNAGNININSSNSINVVGTNLNSKSPSFIDSSNFLLVDLNLQNLLYRQPPVLIGQAGNIFVNTNIINISNGGLISARNQGLNDAGNIKINANTININNQGEVNATTAIGEGGNITFNSRNLFLNNGIVSATAGGSGNGGNIIVNTGILVGSNNSQIVANAFEGRGGKIQINAPGFFLSSDSRIDSRSQRGIDGTVDINANVFLAQTPVKSQAFQESPQIVSTCQGRSNTKGNNEFIITGTGGLPTSSEQLPDVESTWQANSTENISYIEPTVDNEIIEVQGWVKNSDGSITLTAQANPVSANANQSASSCNYQPKPKV